MTTFDQSDCSIDQSNCRTLLRVKILRPLPTSKMSNITIKFLNVKAFSCISLVTVSLRTKNLWNQTIRVTITLCSLCYHVLIWPSFFTQPGARFWNAVYIYVHKIWHFSKNLIWSSFIKVYLSIYTYKHLSIYILIQSLSLDTVICMNCSSQNYQITLVLFLIPRP